MDYCCETRLGLAYMVSLVSFPITKRIIPSLHVHGKTSAQAPIRLYYSKGVESKDAISENSVKEFYVGLLRVYGATYTDQICEEPWTQRRRSVQ